MKNIDKEIESIANKMIKGKKAPPKEKKARNQLMQWVG